MRLQCPSRRYRQRIPLSDIFSLFRGVRLKIKNVYDEMKKSGSMVKSQRTGFYFKALWSAVKLYSAARIASTSSSVEPQLITSLITERVSS